MRTMPLCCNNNTMTLPFFSATIASEPETTFVRQRQSWGNISYALIDQPFVLTRMATKLLTGLVRVSSFDRRLSYFAIRLRDPLKTRKRQQMKSIKVRIIYLTKS